MTILLAEMTRDQIAELAPNAVAVRRQLRLNSMDPTCL